MLELFATFSHQIIHRTGYALLVIVMLLLSLLSGYSGLSYAGSNLLVTPTRVVFDGRTRSAQVTIINQGDESANFRISFIRQNMTEDGNFVPVKKGAPGKYSDEMIRYSPRQVTLEPGKPQVIRLLLRKPRNLEEGEYRSHMLMQALPNPKQSNIEQLRKNTRKDGITVELLPIVGITIPVIVRHGNLSASLTLSDLQVVNNADKGGKKTISVLMSREGNSSVYGDFKAVFTPAGGKPVVIGQVIGVAVYTPNPARRFHIPLQIPPDFKLANGQLHLTFTESGKSPETGLLAEIKTRL